MVNPLAPDDYMQRRVLRKGESAATGGPAYQLLQLDEARDGFRYQEARAQVLLTFLDRPPRLHHGEQVVALLEPQARTNLAAALSRLAQ